MSILDLPDNERAWLLSRAKEADVIDGVLWPRYSYLRLSRRFRASRRIALSRYAIRRLIVWLDPELARGRGDPYPIARLARKN